MNKTCSKCRESKPRFMYNKHAGRADGIQSACRHCTTEASREYYRKNGTKMRKQIGAANRRRTATLRKRVDAYLQSHPCVDCGFSDIRALDFDHVRGTKKDFVVRLIAGSYSWQVVEDEIAKCDVRCSNCHRIRHAKERIGS